MFSGTGEIVGPPLSIAELCISNFSLVLLASRSRPLAEARGCSRFALTPKEGLLASRLQPLADACGRSHFVLTGKGMVYDGTRGVPVKDTAMFEKAGAVLPCRVKHSGMGLSVPTDGSETYSVE